LNSSSAASLFPDRASVFPRFVAALASSTSFLLGVAEFTGVDETTFGASSSEDSELRLNEQPLAQNAIATSAMTCALTRRILRRQSETGKAMDAEVSHDLNYHCRDIGNPGLRKMHRLK
jgi:hypothetical protein